MKPKKPNLSERVIALIEAARQKVSCAANLAQVYTNYEIGRQIVEEEQGGKRRAGYGEKILIELSAKLTARYGRGWSVENLTLMRKFFMAYSGAMISQTSFTKSSGEIVNAVYEIDQHRNCRNAGERIPQFALSWSHYLVLMRIADVVKRDFYERAAIEGEMKIAV